MMTAQRMLFFAVAGLISGGIFLSGWDHVHWLLYLPVVMWVCAGATGICPGLLLLKKMGCK